MKRLSRKLRVLKWTSTILCLVVLCAGASTLRWISYAFADQYSDGVILAGGAISFVGEPEPMAIFICPLGPPSTDWQPRVQPCRWDVARWWWSHCAVKPGTHAPTHRDGFTIPLWIPFVVLGIPAGILWELEWQVRRRVRQALLAALTPVRPLRPTFWLVVALCALHVGAVLGGAWLLITATDFAVTWAITLPGTVLIASFFVLLLGTPMWGYLWARAFTAYRNHLFRRRTPHGCGHCGYDLTGNTSGRCPECGTAIST